MTTFPLIINGNSLTSDSNNNTYTYRFPAGSVHFEDSKIAVSNISIYYSWFNITSRYQNNTYSFLWDDGLVVQYDVLMPDGFYDVAAINSFFQTFCIDNGLYLIDGDGNFVYYLEFIENPTFYSVQVNSYPIPTALPAGWTEPANWVGYPAALTTPQLIVNADGFRDIIGFDAGTYPAAPQMTIFTKLSDFVPQVSPVQSLIVSCSLLNNRFSNPNTVLYSFNASNTEFGALLTSRPVEHYFVDIQQGSYSEFSISFLDQNFNAVAIQDTNLVVTLLIKSKEDLY